MEYHLPVHGPPTEASRTLVRAAQYIRMSTEHQQYSTENQADVIREYAQRRGYDIVQTYADAGKSGLRIEGRESLQKLLDDVTSKRADFKTILVYDISRWGRFQDSDESAYYEYVCKRAGIHVEYCAEQFENDGSPTATIIKSVKRAMAGEYSRELSTKVFKGQCKLIELGFRQGGAAGYGLRRMLVGMNGEPKGILKRGEHKSLQTDRVVLVPGPEDERQTVRRIYDLFTREGWREGQISQWLNAQGIVYAELARPWSADMVHQVLTNEKYIGNNVYNRMSFKLKKKRVRNEPAMWVRRNGAFPPIVDPELFFLAQGILLERARRFSNDELLARLRALLNVHGTLTAELIDNAEDMPASSAYQSRFGSLVPAYQAIGFAPDRDYRYLEVNRHLRSLRPPFVEDVIARLQALGATITPLPEPGHLLINGEYTAEIVFVRCGPTPAGTAKWRIDLERVSAPDITVVVRMDPDNQVPMDFFFLPRIDMPASRLRLGETNGVAVDTYRHDSVADFIRLAARATIEVAA